MVNQNVDTWDAHSNIVANHGQHAAEVDKPIAGLIIDLKRRGSAGRNAGDLALGVWPDAAYRRRASDATIIREP